jgi:hypothetical protein
MNTRSIQSPSERPGSFPDKVRFALKKLKRSEVLGRVKGGRAERLDNHKYKGPEKERLARQRKHPPTQLYSLPICHFS